MYDEYMQRLSSREILVNKLKADNCQIEILTPRKPISGRHYIYIINKMSNDTITYLKHIVKTRFPSF
jgi:hypothetical protein